MSSHLATSFQRNNATQHFAMVHQAVNELANKNIRIAIAKRYTEALQNSLHWIDPTGLLIDQRLVSSINCRGTMVKYLGKWNGDRGGQRVCKIIVSLMRTKRKTSMRRKCVAFQTIMWTQIRRWESNMYLPAKWKRLINYSKVFAICFDILLSSDLSLTSIKVSSYVRHLCCRRAQNSPSSHYSSSVSFPGKILLHPAIQKT